MNKTIQDYFNLEKQYLQHALQHFSEQQVGNAFDKATHELNPHDPHIERLIEGVAYLNARVKQQIDVGTHEVTATLLQHLRPEYTRPQPSRTIVHFSSQRQQHTDLEVIPKTINLRTKAGQEPSIKCQFMTERSMTLQPLSIINTTFEHHETEGPCVRLFFEVNAGTILQDLELGKLSLFLNGDLDNAMTWFYYLTNQVKQIVLKDEHGEKKRIGGQEILIALEDESGIDTLDDSSQQRAAFELLKDFFLFPTRFLFLELSLSHLKVASYRFSIEIFFSSAPVYQRISADFLVPHCVPAKNVYSVTTEPLRYQTHQKEYPLVLEQKNSTMLGLYAIKEVTGTKKHSAEPIRFIDFYSLKSLELHEPSYLLRKLSEKGHQVSHSMVLGGELPEAMAISIDAEVHNGYYPCQSMKTHDLTLHDERVSTQVVATNVTKPSQFFNPNFKPGDAAKILSATQISFNRLINLDFLKEFLTLHDWSGQAEQFIRALRQIEVLPINRLKKGVFRPGVQIKIEVLDTVFFKDHILYFWGFMFFRLYRLFVPINTSLHLTIRATPSGQAFDWDTLV